MSAARSVAQQASQTERDLGTSVVCPVEAQESVVGSKQQQIGSHSFAAEYFAMSSTSGVDCRVANVGIASQGALASHSLQLVEHQQKHRTRGHDVPGNGAMTMFAQRHMPTSHVGDSKKTNSAAQEQHHSFREQPTSAQCAAIARDRREDAPSRRNASDHESARTRCDRRPRHRTIGCRSASHAAHRPVAERLAMESPSRCLSLVLKPIEWHIQKTRRRREK